MIRCNNCMELFKSENDLKKIVEKSELIDGNWQTTDRFAYDPTMDLNNTDDTEYEIFNGCPCCNSDEYLMDLTPYETEKDKHTYKEFIDTIDFSEIQKGNGIYEYPITTIGKETLSLGISYETNDDAQDIYVYNLFCNDEYINISTTVAPTKKYDSVLLAELNDATPSTFKCYIA